MLARLARPGGYCLLLLTLCAPAGAAAVDALVDEYVEGWKHFYPSEALRRGFLDSMGSLEDLSPASIRGWVELNQRLLESVEAIGVDDAVSLQERIDARLLRTQILKELERWERERPHQRSLPLYSGLITRALEPLLESTTLAADERRRLLSGQLDRVGRLADSARTSLEDGRPESTRSAIERLRAFAAEIRGNDALGETRGETAGAIERLAAHVETQLLNELTLPDEPILGRDVYAARLAVYTDSELTPERLERLALEEIEASKAALAAMSVDYWRATYPDEPVTDDPAALIARGFADLEANRPTAEQPYLEDLRRYGREVEAFVRDHRIATVPEHNTLSIELAPESSGPMARIGFVRSAPPFHPNPWTTWYLATIPDSHPEQDRIDFWRSFNYSFKRFIVIHELFPGHYMQLKVLRENPHPVRILFPYRPFIEGWATFTERIVLDAGYAEGDWLTRLAQLRKRLENANRAYMSVQAHCNGWTEEQVFEYSVETSLLAPQFAKSLWGRLMRSPMQILTYMLMGLELRDLYEREIERLGDRFVLRDFMDTILRTGPVPTDALEAVLRAEMP